MRAVSRMTWRGLVAVMAAALVASACGDDGGVTIEPGDSSASEDESGDGPGDAGASDGEDADAPGEEAADTQAAIAPRCEELNDPPYDPPAEEQPPTDPSLTHPEPHPDIDPIEPGGPTDPLSALRQWAEQDAAEHFAGIWIDTDNGATVAAFTDDVDAYADEVRARFGAGWWVVQAPHSQAELFEVQSDINEEMERHWNDGGGLAPGVLNSSGIDVRKGRVAVGVMEPDEARLTQLSERHGTDAICFEIGRFPTEDDAQPAPWEPAADADLSAISTSVDVLINERGCAGGESADGRIAEPEVVYEADQIVVTMRVIPVAGAATCPGNPDTAYTLTLDEPLGDRVLLDGSQSPPAEPTLDGHR